MKLSVIMPVLNGEQFLQQAISSVGGQTHDNWELLIMDGGSTDGSVEIASTFAAADSRIRFYSAPDAGMYDAIMSGFRKSDGDWLSWLNSDDLYTPWCFATVREFIENRDCDWLAGYPSCWDDEGRLRYARPSGLHPRQLISAGWFHEGLLGFLQQESIFFSRHIFNMLTDRDITRIQNMRLAGDFLLWRYFAKQTHLHTLPSVLGGFRRHARNASTASAKEYRDEVLSTNPFTPPRMVGKMIALPFRVASAWSMMHAAAHADNRLTADLRKNSI